jgi:hypothetical protein
MRLTLPSRQATIARLPQRKDLCPFKNGFHPVLERLRTFVFRFPKACLPQAGMEFMIQSWSLDWIIRNLPPCPLCLCGEPGFERADYPSKNPIKSTKGPRNSP